MKTTICFILNSFIFTRSRNGRTGVMCAWCRYLKCVHIHQAFMHGIFLVTLKLGPENLVRCMNGWADRCGKVIWPFANVKPMKMKPETERDDACCGMCKTKQKHNWYFIETIWLIAMCSVAIRIENIHLRKSYVRWTACCIQMHVLVLVHRTKLDTHWYILVDNHRKISHNIQSWPLCLCFDSLEFPMSINQTRRFIVFALEFQMPFFTHTHIGTHTDQMCSCLFRFQFLKTNFDNVMPEKKPIAINYRRDSCAIVWKINSVVLFRPKLSVMAATHRATRTRYAHKISGLNLTLPKLMGKVKIRWSMRRRRRKRETSASNGGESEEESKK